MGGAWFLGLKHRDSGRLGVRGRLKEGGVAASECYCLRMNVSKAEMMMAGEARGGGAPWRSGSFHGQRCPLQDANMRETERDGRKAEGWG